MDNKKNYAEILKSPEWSKKRYAILKRDNFNCQKCRSINNLQVHHKVYLKGKMPWEVPNHCLITLCRSCHEKEHENRKISSFFKKQKPKKRKPKMLFRYVYVPVESKCHITGITIYIKTKVKEYYTTKGRE